MDLKDILSQNQKELDILKLLQVMSSNIESKKIVEEISDSSIIEDGRLVEIEKSSSLDEAGGVQDSTISRIRVHESCGCISRGKENFGLVCSVCFRTTCNKEGHFSHCLICGRPLCIRCRKLVNDKPYCATHAFWARISKFLRLG